MLSASPQEPICQVPRLPVEASAHQVDRVRLLNIPIYPQRIGNHDIMTPNWLFQGLSPMVSWWPTVLEEAEAASGESASGDFQQRNLLSLP